MIRGSLLPLLPFPQSPPESGSLAIWRIGTSGWSYPLRSGPGSWTGIFYPLKKTDELQFYSRYFNTVEINTTFYRPCNSKTAEAWAERTPSGFQFTVKVWQKFTHTRELVTGEDVGLFREGIEPIVRAGKLGAVLFQFPASFRCDDATRDRLRGLLDAFADCTTAVELRHRSWDENLDVLDEAGATPVFIDEPKFRDSTRQPLRAPHGVLYIRLHGRNAAKWWTHDHRNERYDYLYSREEIERQAARLTAAADEQSIQRAYVFFNNHPSAKAVVNAAMLREELGLSLEEPLPPTLKAAFPGQLQA